MALQDLTPQLRTRLSRMERAAGWFVLLAAVLMIAGLAYYLKIVSERKGWGIQKIQYQTSLVSAAGLKVGNPVKLMGFDVGEITRIEANDPYAYYGITVFFRVKKPYYGYLWSDSTVKISADFLGNRSLEITKGERGVPTVLETTNKTAVGLLLRHYLDQQFKQLTNGGKSREDALAELNTAAFNNQKAFYTNLTEHATYWLQPSEEPTINERVEKLVNQIEAALPGITNQLITVLANVGRVSANADGLLTSLLPTSTNLAFITENIRDPHGSLGEWLIPTNINRNLEGTLGSANTNLPIIAEDLDRMIIDLANITSNLNAQVQANSNILSGISKTVTDTDDLVQGLKRHWLLRSAFKTKKTNAPTPPRR